MGPICQRSRSRNRQILLQLRDRERNRFQRGRRTETDRRKADEIGTVSKGSYSYEAEGVTYTVNWVADENGFQASGVHLPVAPPMPAHVVQLLADLRAAGKL